MITVQVVAFVIGALAQPFVRHGLINVRSLLARPGVVLAPIFFPTIAEPVEERKP